MKISKTRDVKTPTRGTPKSAGLDFYVPSDMEKITVEPNKACRIDSGIRAEVPAGHALIAFNKSGIALSGLQVGACVVDEDYQGAINLHLFNVSDKTIEIQPGQKLAQFILLPMFYDGVEVVEDAELHTEKTERGSGAFSSTGLY
jgi:dUTP pyrophosphatase